MDNMSGQSLGDSAKQIDPRRSLCSQRWFGIHLAMELDGPVAGTYSMYTVAGLPGHRSRGCYVMPYYSVVGLDSRCPRQT